MERNWARLGTRLAEARGGMGITQLEMAKRIGVSRGPMQAIERGDAKRVTSTMRAYARAVGWTDESIDAVLGGGEPTLVDPAPDSPEPVPTNTNVDDVPYAQGMPARIAFELRDGTILDTDVIDLSAPGSDAKLVLVAKAGAADASPEQQRADLLRWAEIQRKIRKIVAEELSNP